MADDKVDFDDIDLELDPEEELAKLEAEADKEGDAPPEEDDGPTEAEEEEATEVQAAVAEKAPDLDVKAALEDLRLERMRLQEQLNAVSAASLDDRRKMIEMERYLEQASQAAQQQPEERQPDPAVILSQLDQRIAQVDAALSRAELEDPGAAPELRRHLRTLERYYTNYLTQAQLSSVEAAREDPRQAVEQALEATTVQHQFTSVREEVINEFPILDPKSKYFDADLRDEVHAVYNPMIASGMNPAEALARTVNLVTAARGIPPLSRILEMQGQQDAQKAAPPAKGKAAARKKEAVERNVAAAEATPPNLASMGQSNTAKGMLDKYQFSDLSITEMMRIPDAELERIEEALLLYGD
jgi:hypothetical protein